ncbi:MAG: FAD-dependent oxidoreductase [Candidatus Methanomethylophilus sp.]|nr:FAD-dependent oxidoreductase [Methanomethylophilus sp.]
MDADVVIIGAGPAGIQAAIHAARKKAVTVLVGKTGNSAMYGTELENYFGLQKVQSGTDVLSNGIEQAKSFGCTVFDMNVMSLSKEGDLFKASLEDGSIVSARALIIATGIARVRLGVPGEREFANGKGVSYCATCDCNFYRQKTVALVGGQAEAVSDAEFMTRYASKVYLISPEFDTSPVLLEAAEKAGVIRIDAAVTEILGEGKVNAVKLSNGKTVELDGVFIELGGKSSADLAMEVDLMPEIDDTLKVDRNCATSVPGVFACGDITGKPWQVAKAVGEGCIAGLSAVEYAKKVKE